MKFSGSTVILTLLATAQAGPVVRIRDNDALEYRSVSDLFGALATLSAKSQEQASTVSSAAAPETKAVAQNTGENQKASEKQAANNEKAATNPAAGNKAVTAAEDPATLLKGASDALKVAATAVDQAITASIAAPATGAVAGENNNKNNNNNNNNNSTAATAEQAAGKKTADKAAKKGAAKGAATAAANNATASTETGAKGAAKGALTKAAGGAVVAKTADGLLLPDGRIGANVVATDFNVVTSVYKSAVVKGDGLVFSDIITFPGTQPSIFDAAGKTKAFTININDSSIFTPQGGAPQTQFRRADLLPSIISTAQNSSVTGVRTMHFSIQQDPAKPLALATNEYQLAFLETADFESRTFDVRVGTGTTGPSLDGKNIVVFGRSGAAIKELFVAPFSTDLQNFAITLDFDKNTMQVFHSTGATPLAQVSEVVANDNSGGGEYHIALLKLADAQGQQAAGINEAMTFSGVFMEDSSDGTVSLQ